MLSVCARVRGAPAASAAVSLAAPSGSTPTTSHGRGERRHGHRDAGDEAAAAHRHQDGPDIGPLLEDLETDGALPGDHVGMIERRDHRQTLLPRDGLGPRALLGRPGGARQHHLATIAPHPVDLHLWGGFGHHHHRPEPEVTRGESQCLPVIAARGGDHAPRPASCHQPRQCVIGTADLERADRLEELTLEGDGNADPGGQIGRLEEGGAHRHAVEHPRRGAKRFDRHGGGPVCGLRHRYPAKCAGGLA